MIGVNVVRVMQLLVLIVYEMVGWLECDGYIMCVLDKLILFIEEGLV